MKNLRSFLCYTFVFWISIAASKSQDCDTSINFSLLQEIGDTAYLDQLKSLEKRESHCQMALLSQYYFERYAYKKVIFISSQLLTKNLAEDSVQILQHWYRLTNAYHELGIPDSSLHYGRQLLLAMDQNIHDHLDQIPRILETVAMNYADKLQYDLAFEWLDLIGLHLKILGLGESEAFAAMLYVKSAINSLRGDFELAQGLLDSIITIYHGIENPTTTSLLRTHSLAIRYNIFMQEPNKIEQHIAAYNKLQASNVIIDTATHIGFLMNTGYHELIQGNSAVEESLFKEAVVLAKDFNKIPIIWAKVAMFKAANLIANEDLLGAVELAKEILHKIEGEDFLEGSFRDLRGTLLELISANLFNYRKRSGANSSITEIWKYRSSYSRYISKKFLDGNLANSKFELSAEELNSLDDNLLACWNYFKTDHPTDSIEIAYNFFEEYKGFIFNYQKSQRQVYARQQKNNETFKNSSNLLKEISKNEKEYTRMNAEEYRLGIIRERLKLRNEYFLVNAKISQNFKAFLTEIEIGNILSFEEFQNYIRQSNKTFVNYYITEKYLYSLIFSPSKNIFARQNVTRDSLNSKIENLRAFIEDPNSKITDEYQKANDYLYNCLIKPHKKFLTKEVIVIGHGELFQIPFGSIYSTIPSNKYNFKNYDWLIKSHQFTYSPTITSYFYNSNSSNKTNLEVLAIAPKFLNSKSTSLVRNKIGKLAHNVEEAQTISSILNGNVLIGNVTTKNNIYKSILESTIVHFATHTVTSRNDRSTQTNLVLSTGISDSFELTELKEIFPIDNEVKLVVLSACNTNFGEPLPGEGYISLASEFFKEGASTVISNSWNANDYSMKNIFEYFYKHIRNEKSISTSLRDSKLEYLQNSPNELAHPFYWSGLTTIGNGDLYFVEPNNISIIIGLLVFLILIVFKVKFSR